MSDIKISIKNLLVKNLKINKIIIDTIAMEIPKNEITAIIGPSGSGKTTLLKCINRMIDLDRQLEVTGTILSEGTEITSKGIQVSEIRRKFAMIFALPVPFPCSIYENVALGARLGGIKKRTEIDVKVEKSLQDAALWNEVKDRLKDEALTLSGGQQQRLCIARSLALNPEVLMFDEATSGLDPISTAKIEETVLNLKHKTTIIWVTNHVKQAARISDHTGFLLMGDLVEFSNTANLFMAPKNVKTEDYISGKFG